MSGIDRVKPLERAQGVAEAIWSGCKGAIEGPRARTIPKRFSAGASMGMRVRVAGTEICYDDVGEGRPIVCLHAIGHGAADFRKLAELLGGSYRMIALDWPGQGGSGADAEPASIRRYTELLKAFLDELQIPSAVLLGNSIGGGAALRFAALHPERVDALVIENPAGIAPTTRSAQRFIQLMSRAFGQGAAGARWFPLFYSAYCQLLLPERPAREQRQRILEAAYETAPVLSQAWASFVEPDSDLRGQVPNIAVPTLVLWADQDRINRFSWAKPVLSSMPNVTIQHVQAGHSPHLERPEEVASSVRAFVEGACG